ncbi:MAG: tRNA epoxyqueuosine(34) reductase QueG [Acidobacteria bacterium]|nr:tRNA epoxyqueuosine(34) reductase QueG [Acidobacteriota bacterium]
MLPSEFVPLIKQQSRAFGFDACGIAPPSGLPELSAFKEWLARGYAGEMTFLERSADLRADAHGALESARSVIVLATVYNTERPFSIDATDPRQAHISRYAWGDDYHHVLMRRMDQLIAWMHQVHTEPFNAAPYVDTGPVQERVFARHAGIGWIGKNCCVINPELGSFIFLSEIICSLELPPDVPAADRCGACTLCLRACPTQALVAPGVLDARRCISYLTIEQRGEIPDELKPAVGTHVYGCDICQEVCPYNATAPESGDPAWQPRSVWDGRSVDELLHLSDADLKTALVNSAMSRARKAGLRRNFQVAADNAGGDTTLGRRVHPGPPHPEDGA